MANELYRKYERTTKHVAYFDDRQQMEKWIAAMIPKHVHYDVISVDDFHFQVKWTTTEILY